MSKESGEKKTPEWMWKQEDATIHKDAENKQKGYIDTTEYT